jgi:hypothetical protein
LRMPDPERRQSKSMNNKYFGYGQHYR